MKNLLIAFTFGLLFLLTGCTKITITPTTEEPQQKEEIIVKEPEIKIDMTNKEAVIGYALSSIKDKNIDQLASVASKDGIRFSPYSYVDTTTHITMKNEQLKEAFNSETEYVRGSEDGSGFPILLTFKNYINRYVYDADFQKLSEKNYDKVVQRGNEINNIEDIYTGASTVEFFIPGINPEYEGMDRKSLTFVLQQEDKERKIRAIVHGEWTI